MQPKNAIIGQQRWSQCVSPFHYFKIPNYKDDMNTNLTVWTQVLFLIVFTTGKGVVYSFDPVGSYGSDGYRARGSAAAMLQPLLDNQVGPLSICYQKYWYLCQDQDILVILNSFEQIQISFTSFKPHLFMNVFQLLKN